MDQYEYIKTLLNEFKNYKYIILTLFLKNEEILKQRVLAETRDSGFRDFDESIKFNKRLGEELKFLNEYKIDNTNQSSEETANQIKDLLSDKKSPTMLTSPSNLS